MNVVLIGYGDTGTGLYRAYGDIHNIDIHDPEKGWKVSKRKADILLVAIPYTKEFVKTVKDYRDYYGTENVIIFSTVPIGTTSQIPGAVHSPIEAPNSNMDFYYIREAIRFIGGKWSKTVREFFKVNMTFWLPKPEHTEFLKLRSLLYYAVGIEFARYSGEVAKNIGMNYDNIKMYDREYNRSNDKFGRPEYQRYVLDAPEGQIDGGIIQNIPYLHMKFPHPFIGFILHTQRH